jgi:hypothetical protein
LIERVTKPLEQLRFQPGVQQSNNQAQHSGHKAKQSKALQQASKVAGDTTEQGKQTHSTGTSKLDGTSADNGQQDRQT